MRLQYSNQTGICFGDVFMMTNIWHKLMVLLGIRRRRIPVFTPKETEFFNRVVDRIKDDMRVNTDQS